MSLIRYRRYKLKPPTEIHQLSPRISPFACDRLHSLFDYGDIQRLSSTFRAPSYIMLLAPNAFITSCFRCYAFFPLTPYYRHSCKRCSCERRIYLDCRHEWATCRPLPAPACHAGKCCTLCQRSQRAKRKPAHGFIPGIRESAIPPGGRRQPPLCILDVSATQKIVVTS
jgi:hypothetical protein